MNSAEKDFNILCNSEEKRKQFLAAFQRLEFETFMIPENGQKAFTDFTKLAEESNIVFNIVTQFAVSSKIY